MLSNEELFLMGNVEKLYEKNQPFMNFIAKKYASQDCLLGELEFDDCIGCGNIAFVKALKSFNPDKCKWTTYFSKIMINEIMHLKPRDRDIMILRYGLMNNDELTQKEVAEKLGISQSYISRIEKKVIKRLKMLVNLS